MTATHTSAPTSAQLAGVQLPAPGTYAIDASHSEINVLARHLMVSKVRGQFASFEGAVVIAEDPLVSSVEVVVDASSIDTRDAKRDEHLRSADFLDVEQFPALTFRSTGLEHVKGDRFRLTGDLTVRDVTKPITFDLEYTGRATNPWGHEVIGFEAKGEIDREEFGVTWNVALETGGVLVSKKLTFELDIEAVRQS